MTIKLPKIGDITLPNIGAIVTQKKETAKDAGMGIAFVAAIAVILLVAGYVISRMSADRANKAKWQDYNDCGWA